MKLLIKKQIGLEIPKKAHDSDSCFDLIASEEGIVYGERENFQLYSDFQNLGRLYKSVQFIEYRTNVFIAPQEDFIRKKNYGPLESKKYCTFIYPRSSISNKNLSFANSVSTIDNGYRGELLIRFRYISQPEDLCIIPESGITRIYTKINQEKIYHKGDKIGQLFVTELINTEFELLDNLEQTTRNNGGFGSTG